MNIYEQQMVNYMDLHSYINKQIICIIDINNIVEKDTTFTIEQIKTSSVGIKILIKSVDFDYTMSLELYDNRFLNPNDTIDYLLKKKNEEYL